METKNNLKIHNINTRRRSYNVVDSTDFIIDLLEKKVHPNQLLNMCFNGTIPEKARPLIWMILLNIIPFNNPEEWLLYFKKYSQIYENKLDKFLKINNCEEENESDYEAISRNLIKVNNENIQKSDFSNVNKVGNIRVGCLTKSSDKVDANESKNYSNIKNNTLFFKNENLNEKQSEIEKEDKTQTRKKLEILNIDNHCESNYISHENNNYLTNSNINLDINKNTNIHNLHFVNFISEASTKENNESDQIFEMIPNKIKIDKFYLFYSETDDLSIEKAFANNAEISEASHIIKLDVERTFQEIDLYKSTVTKEILCSTLFAWYCDNSDMGYRQGMNEILATIFYATFNINEPKIFDLIGDSIEKEKNHENFFKLWESEKFFNVILYVIFDQILAMGMKSIYNYQNCVDNKEFSYTEEKSNFEFIKEEIENDKSAEQLESQSKLSSDISSNNTILQKHDFNEINIKDKKKKNNFLNLDKISTLLHNNAQSVKNNFKAIKQFIMKTPWELKKSKNDKSKYYSNENNQKKIDFKIFESENMDRLNLEQILLLEQSDLRRRVNLIFFYYLKSFDAELYNHLLNKIDPYIVIFRWILCMFNREIGLKYVVFIWDSIFAVEYLEKNSSSFVKSFKNKKFKNLINNFNFVNFICVSIFEDMKKELLQEEEGCYVLQMLMHFPNEKNVKNIIKRALKIRDFIYGKLNISNDFVFKD